VIPEHDINEDEGRYHTWVRVENVKKTTELNERLNLSDFAVKYFLHTLRTLRPPRLDRFFSSGIGRAFLVRALSGSTRGKG